MFVFFVVVVFCCCCFLFISPEIREDVDSTFGQSRQWTAFTQVLEILKG